MLQKDIVIGGTYRAKVSNRLVDVLVLRQVESRVPFGSRKRRNRFMVRNLRTNREICMTAGKMRYPVIV